MASFRCVLHDQLAAELAVGQAALQLFAATQQERQPDPQQQDTHEQQQDALAKIRQQLESCHFAALWGQHNRSSSSSVQEGVGSKQQLLQLLVSKLLVGPLAVMSDVLGQTHAEDGCEMQHQQQPPPQPCTLVLEQLLQAAVAGVGTTEHSNASDKQQQQQHGLENALSLLLSQLGQSCWCAKADQQANRNLQQQSAGSSAAQGAAAAAVCGVEVCSDPVAGVQLAAFTRGLCNLLLLRLLSHAPPCECWSWDACLAVTQLLASCEQAAAAAGGLMYQALCQHPAAMQWASTCGTASLGSCKQLQQDPNSSNADHQQQQTEQQEEGQGGAAAGGVAGRGDAKQGFTATAHASMLLYSQQLQAVLQQLHTAEQALEACHCSSSSSSAPSCSARGGSSSRTPDSQDGVHPQQQQQQPPQQQQQQQQELEQEFAAPSFWRSLLLALYQKSRPSGSGFLQQCFSAFGADNNTPGFWALVGLWLLCADVPDCWGLAWHGCMFGSRRVSVCVLTTFTLPCGRLWILGFLYLEPRGVCAAWLPACLGAACQGCAPDSQSVVLDAGSWLAPSMVQATKWTGPTPGTVASTMLGTARPAVTVLLGPLLLS
jgi:hypothetical protein